MALRKTISSCGSGASKDNVPSRTVENLNIPHRVTEQEEAPPPTLEGMAQMLSNWERFIGIQTRFIEIQAQAEEAQVQVARSQTQGQSSMTSGSTFD